MADTEQLATKRQPEPDECVCLWTHSFSGVFDRPSSPCVCDVWHTVFLFSQSLISHLPPEGSVRQLWVITAMWHTFPSRRTHPPSGQLQPITDYVYWGNHSNRWNVPHPMLTLVHFTPPVCVCVAPTLSLLFVSPSWRKWKTMLPHQFHLNLILDLVSVTDLWTGSKLHLSWSGCFTAAGPEFVGWNNTIHLTIYFLCVHALSCFIHLSSPYYVHTDTKLHETAALTVQAN